MRLDTGLIVELWNKGMLWDKLLGLHWLPLTKVHHSNKVLYNSLCLLKLKYNTTITVFIALRVTFTSTVHNCNFLKYAILKLNEDNFSHMKIMEIC